MSSLAATQADGYYIPPAHFDNTKPGRQPPSKNQVTQSKGHNQYLQRGVVRFELPYSGLCQQCEQYIGRGTRFNAQKKEVGKYLTSTIWQFEMTCRNCHTQTFLIQTNPQEYGFDYVQGITKLEHKKELSSTAAPSHVNNSTAAAAGQASSGSELERLERVVHGQRTVMSEYDELQALQTLNGKTYLNDADVNAQIRSKFRTERYAHQQRVIKAKEKGWIKPGMQLLDEDHDMAQVAKSMRFGPTAVPQQQHHEAKYRQLQSSSIFDKAKTTSSRSHKRRRRLTDGVALAPPDVPKSTTPVPERSKSSLQQQQAPLTKRKRLVAVQALATTQQAVFSSSVDTEIGPTDFVPLSAAVTKTTNPLSDERRNVHCSDNNAMLMPSFENADMMVQSGSDELPDKPNPTSSTSLLLAAYASSSDDDDDDGQD